MATIQRLTTDINDLLNKYKHAHQYDTLALSLALLPNKVLYESK